MSVWRLPEQSAAQRQTTLRRFAGSEQRPGKGNQPVAQTAQLVYNVIVEVV
jgi:hypothetical protein